MQISEKQQFAMQLLERPDVNELLLGGSAGGPQPLDAEVKTPFGAKKMGEIKIGDQILNVNGGVSRVIDIPYEGVRQVYKITFADGSVTRAADNHIWKYKLARNRRRKHLDEYVLGTTTQLVEKLDKYHILIPLTQPTTSTKNSQGEEIKPYALGAILGGGSITRGYITFTSSDEEVVENLAHEISGETHKLRKYQYSLVKCDKEVALLKKWGLWGHKSNTEFIPKRYKDGSIATRWAILQGLLDTDGAVDSRGHVSFTSTSKQLAEDVQYIVRSLGGNATLTCNKAGYRKNGMWVQCSDAYHVYIQHPDKANLFRLSRKKNRVKPYNGGHMPHKRITNIEPLGEMPVRCITTSSADGLYLTDDFIVTHNSKSWTMCMMMVTLCRLFPGVRLFLGRKTLQSLKKSTISTLVSKVHPFMGVSNEEFKLRIQEGEVVYKNGSIIYFGELEKRPEDPDFARVGSLEIDCAFIDEAGEISIEAKNAIKSRVGRGVMANNYGIPGKVILSCNPSQNFLRQEYYDPYIQKGGGGYQEWQIGNVTVEGEKIPSYRAFLRISAFDNPFLPESYIDTLRSLPKRERKRLLDGDWNYADDDDSLFASTLLDKATAYDMPPITERFQKYIGVDLSDKGGDKTIFTLINNGYVVTQKRSSVQMKWDEKSDLPMSRLITDELIEFAQRNGFTSRFAKHIAVECNGIGVGVRDMLKERGWYITEYTATHKSRSQGFYQLMLDFDSGDLKLSHDLLGMDELRKQLATHTFEMINQEPSVLKKEKIKQILGHSPDEADSLMIANYCRNWISHPENDPRTNANRLGV